MKKDEFKQLIKESVREVLLTEGFLSTIISEVVKGVGTNVVTETVAVRQQPDAKAERAKQEKMMEMRQEEKMRSLKETKRKMLDAIGRDAYGGIDLFEGTTPMRSGGNVGAPSAPNSSLGDVDPGDPGVDISALMGAAGAWKQMIK